MWLCSSRLRTRNQNLGRSAAVRSRRPRWCPARVEALEGRALLAASPIVPTFNGGQLVTTPIADSSTALSVPSAVAAQSDGRIVVVGTNDPAVTGATNTTSTLYVTRTNPDGTLDSTFGTGGQATITLPTVANPQIVPGREVLIQPDGRIIVAAILESQSTTGTTVVGSVVVRLTATGSPDPTFGTSGETLITTNTPSLGQLALQADGGIVLAGMALIPRASGGSIPQTAVTRLTATGAVDPTFNGGQQVLLNQTYDDVLAAYAVGVTSTGAIKVVAPGPGSTEQYAISQLTSSGALDPTFNGGQPLLSSDTTGDYPTAATVTTDGQVLLSIKVYGNYGNYNSSTIVRVNADGSTGPTLTVPGIGLIATDLIAGSDGTITFDGYSETGGNYLIYGRFRADGTPDTTFGPGGIARVYFTPTLSGSLGSRYVLVGSISGALAQLANGQVAVAGRFYYATSTMGAFDRSTDLGSQTVVGVLGATNRLLGMDGDYDGDNHADLAAQLTNPGLFALRQSTGGDRLIPFGIPGTGQSVPAPGDYDGDGKTDIAAYLPSLGILAYRPSSGGPDVLTRFGPTGLGTAIPVPGDYDGDGRTDVALFLPGSATFIIDPSSGSAPYAVQFGAGSGLSIPVVGDYDGGGRTELGVYIPTLGTFYHRPLLPGTDVAQTIGPAGPGASIPIVGDYDGDGRDDLALYLTSTGTFGIVGSANFNQAVATLTQFGAPGVGQSIPIAGDYNGDGRDDLAVHLPGLGAFAIRPSGGTTAADRIEFFGTSGPATVAVAEPAYLASTSTVAAQSLGSSRASAADGLVVYLPDDLPSTTRKKAATTG